MNYFFDKITDLPFLYALGFASIGNYSISKLRSSNSATMVTIMQPSTADTQSYRNDIRQKIKSIDI
jgi:hypothetical protein